MTTTPLPLLEISVLSYRLGEKFFSTPGSLRTMHVALISSKLCSHQRFSWPAFRGVRFLLTSHIPTRQKKMTSSFTSIMRDVGYRGTQGGGWRRHQCGARGGFYYICSMEEDDEENHSQQGISLRLGELELSRKMAIFAQLFCLKICSNWQCRVGGWVGNFALRSTKSRCGPLRNMESRFRFIFVSSWKFFA